MTIARDAIIILILGAALDFLGSPLRSERDLSNLQTCDKSLILGRNVLFFYKSSRLLCNIYPTSHIFLWEIVGMGYLQHIHNQYKSSSSINKHITVFLPSQLLPCGGHFQGESRDQQPLSNQSNGAHFEKSPTILHFFQITDPTLFAWEI